MTVPEEDVHDHDPVCQGHVSAFLFTPSAVTSVSETRRIDARMFCFKSLSLSLSHDVLSPQVHSNQ